MTDAIKSMRLYPHPARILVELQSLGYGDNDALSLEVVNSFDQLHYHGTDALDAAINACGMKEGQSVLEVGSGWGGCARYLAATSGAKLTAIELQQDYDEIARDLTKRTGLERRVSHINADFLELDLDEGSFDHAVSWLALFHIPDRQNYLTRIHAAMRTGGTLFVEDLFAKRPPPKDEQTNFEQSLFPNSLVDWSTYFATLEAAGFEIDFCDDMSSDWTEFTAARLTAFRDAATAYQAKHGASAYEVIESFYDKMAGYFARDLVGGVRFAARKRA